MVQLRLSESGVDETVKQIRARGGIDFLYLLELIVKIYVCFRIQYRKDAPN